MPVNADLIPETGAGVVNANTYATRAEATAYHAPRDNTDWANADESNQVAALIRATDYMDRRWNFPGSQSTTTQGLRWPRVHVFDREGNDVSNTLPLPIKEATIEYALRIVADLGRLMPDPTSLDESGKLVTMKREKVGPLEEETRYSDSVSTSVRVIQPYPEVDRMLILSGLVIPLSNRVIRA